MLRFLPVGCGCRVVFGECCSCLGSGMSRGPTRTLLGLHPKTPQRLFPLPVSQTPPEGSAAPAGCQGQLSRGFPLQVRRAQHTVHSETKYIELAVVNDHQLVSRGVPGAGGGGEGSGWTPSIPPGPWCAPSSCSFASP